MVITRVTGSWIETLVTSLVDGCSNAGGVDVADRTVRSVGREGEREGIERSVTRRWTAGGDAGAAA